VNAGYAAKQVKGKKTPLSKFDVARLEELRVLLPKLKLSAAELQSTIDAIEKVG
jgi:hypothetical protein